MQLRYCCITAAAATDVDTKLTFVPQSLAPNIGPLTYGPAAAAAPAVDAPSSCCYSNYFWNSLCCCLYFTCCSSCCCHSSCLCYEAASAPLCCQDISYHDTLPTTWPDQHVANLLVQHLSLHLIISEKFQHSTWLFSSKQW